MADRIKIGQRVEAGTNDEDYDTGKVVEIEGDKALVAWSSGIQTWTPICVLREVAA